MSLGFRSKVFQLIKTGSAPSNVIEQVRELSVRGLLRELEQGLAPWTVEALRIEKVLMHYPVKRVEQFFFQIHSARPGRTWSPRLPCCPPSRIPRSMIGVDENLVRIHHWRTPLKISIQGETHSYFAAMYR